MAEETKPESLASKVGGKLFGLFILAGLACGYVSVVLLFALNPWTTARLDAIEARQDCAEHGHSWEFMESANTSVIVGSNPYVRWKFRCATCKRDTSRYESQMTDELWRIVERKSGLRRPQKPAAEPNDMPLFRFYQHEPEQKRHIYKNLYVWTGPDGSTIAFE